MLVAVPKTAADVDLTQAIVLGEESGFGLVENPAGARIGVSDIWPIGFDVVDELSQGDCSHFLLVRMVQEMVGLFEAISFFCSHFWSTFIRSISSSSLFE